MSRTVGAIVMVLFVTGACTQESSEIGSDFFTDGSLDFSSIDSTSVSMSTIMMEHMQTSSATRLLVGSHRDSKLGKVEAKTFFQVTVPSSLTLPDAKITYQYCAIVLKYDHYSYYDTAATVTLKAHRVTEDFEPEDDGYFYNDNEFQYESSPLGELSFTPRPNKDDSLEIKLSDSFGSNLYERIIDDDDVLSTNANLVRWLKGFAIISTYNDGGTFLGFDVTPELRVYYTDNNEVPAMTKYLSFPRGTYYFNNLSSDRSETILDLNSSTDRQSSKETDDESYIQSGVGLALRVEFPHARDFARYDNIFITQAILEIYPVRRSSDASTPLPDHLSTYIVDSRNDVLGEYAYEAILMEDIDLERTTHYRLDVSSFVKNQIAREDDNEDAFAFFTPDFSSSLDRVYLDAAGTQYTTRLLLYYTMVNQ